MSLVMDPRRLFYKTIAALALVGGFLFAKSRYDASVVEKAKIAERIKADSVAIQTANEVIRQRNETVAYFVNVAIGLQAKADRDSVAAHKAQVASDSLRRTLVITDTTQVRAVLAADSVTIARKNTEIVDLRATVVTWRNRVNVVRDSVDLAYQDKIAAIDRVNKDIAKSLPQKGTSLLVHLRDAAIGGAVVWVATR